MTDDFESLADRLSASPDYRVLRKLRQPARYNDDASPENLRRALLVDVETTGLSHANDTIIELGVILFTYDASTGRVCEVKRAESWLQDPGRPLPEVIVRLTGITDADVRGQQIDEAAFREMSEGVTFIIAHNASFDRPFIDRRFPFLSDIHWGCSMSDVPWHSLNRGSLKLDYLLYLHTSSFLDTHHRALDDCRATLHVLATAFEDARTPLGLMLANCRAPRVRIAAVQAPFDSRDQLKRRGYAWSGDGGSPAKTWCREMLAADSDAELAWLRDSVYANAGANIPVTKVDLRRRYSAGA